VDDLRWYFEDFENKPSDDPKKTNWMIFECEYINSTEKYLKSG